MSKTLANKILDRIRDGAIYPIHIVNKPSKQRATWKSPFTDEQRAHFAKVAAEQKQIDNMATARELVQMFYAKDKAERNPWLREALTASLVSRAAGTQTTSALA
jgi:hypothetical protein